MPLLPSIWDIGLKPFQELIMKPIKFNDYCITLVDALSAHHGQGTVVEKHRHPWYELTHVTEGYFLTTFYIDDEPTSFKTEAGSIILSPPGVFHSHFHEFGDDGFTFRWHFNCSDTDKNEIGNVLSIPRAYSTIFDTEAFVNSVQNLSGPILQTAFLHWVMSLYDLWRDKDMDTALENDHEKILVEQAVLYINEYYMNDLTVKEIAKSLNVSYRNLARIFKNITGVTIVEKLNDIRVNAAIKLIKETDKTMKEIANEVGLSNEYYFSTLFSRYTYMSPTKFRKKFSK